MTQVDITPRAAYKQALTNIGYEVLPFKGTFENVLENVPREIPLTVTASPQKGIAATVELAAGLAAEGYLVAPHLSARLIRDKEHLNELLDQLREANITRLFTIGGDGKAIGSYTDALGILRDIHESGVGFEDIGVGGYPDGHPVIPDAALQSALREKAPLAHHITTQMCFDADRILNWAHALRRLGVNLPVRVGVPGAVSRQKLLRISAAIGIGNSARFLEKQRSLLWRFFLPGGYQPRRLMRKLTTAGLTMSAITGFHLFTFNDLAGTERWRRRELSVMAND